MRLAGVPLLYAPVRPTATAALWMADMVYTVKLVWNWRNSFVLRLDTFRIQQEFPTLFVQKYHEVE